MVLAPLLAAPTLMLLASWVERRLGPAAGGVIAALPLSIAIIIVALGDEGRVVAASAAAHVVAQVAFALAFAAVMVRRGGLAGLAAGAGAFVAVSLLVSLIPVWVAIVLGVPALAAKIKVPGTFIFEGGSADARVGALIVLVVVATALGVADVAGPALAGTVAAFPALSATFVLLLGRARGPHALGGLLVGLRAYLAFCVIVALSGSVLLGLIGVGAMNLLAARSLSLHVTSSDRGRAAVA